jgi:hypothetical protein
MAINSDPAARREARAPAGLAHGIPGALAIAFDLAGITSVASPRDALLYEQS